MQKLPALLVVGTVSGFVGAGVMWLLMREPRITSMARSSPPSSSAPRSEPSTSRIGRPEKFRGGGREEKRPTSLNHGNPTRHASFAKPAASSTGELPPEHGAEGREGFGLENAIPVMAKADAAIVPRQMSRTILSSEITPHVGRIENALVNALEAATPYVKDGFAVREEYWAGTLSSKSRAITHQLFGGNEYWFWVATDHPTDGVDVHLYDEKGNLAESEHWQRSKVGAARITPARSGSYYLIVSKTSRRDHGLPQTIHWAMTYGFRATQGDR